MISSRSRRCSAVEWGKTPVVEDQQLDAGRASSAAGHSGRRRGRARASRAAAARDGRGRERSSRQALWPRAQAIQSCRPRSGPMISKFWCRSIQSPAASLWNSATVEAAGGAPVDVLDEGGLAQAGELEPGAAAACSHARSPRARPAGPGAPRRRALSTSGWRRCSSSALAMPARPRLRRRSLGGVGQHRSPPQW